jgi:hypothetical protein
MLVASFELSSEGKIVDAEKRSLRDVEDFTSRRDPYDSDFCLGTDRSSISFSVMKHIFFKHGFMAIENLDRKRSRGAVENPNAP